MARVLVVEDNRDVAESLVLLLEVSGHHVRAVEDGAAALSEVHRQLPDAVVLDIGLPCLDGVQVARRLRQRYGQALRLIACTGYDDSSTHQKTIEAGFDAILTKPARIEELLDAIGDASAPRPPDERRRDRYANRRLLSSHVSAAAGSS